jgi:hypothetical protein
MPRIDICGIFGWLVAAVSGVAAVSSVFGVAAVSGVFGVSAVSVAGDSFVLMLRSPLWSGRCPPVVCGPSRLTPGRVIRLHPI